MRLFLSTGLDVLDGIFSSQSPRSQSKGRSRALGLEVVGRIVETADILGGAVQIADDVALCVQSFKLGIHSHAAQREELRTDAAPQQACQSCHSYDSVAAKTARIVPNPHDSHAGEVRCTLCHKEHKASENFCCKCHQLGEKFGYKVP